MRTLSQIFKICVLVLSICFVFIADVTDSQAAGSVSDRVSLETLISQSDQDLDLTDALLTVSKDWNPKLDLDVYRRKLDQLTEKLQKQLDGNQSPERLLSVLRDTLYQKEGFAYTDKVDSQGIPLNSEEIFLHGLLDSKRGYCMTLSLLHLILGERLGLPLYGVALPNHFFVRYESGSKRINIETTQSGVSLPDTYYRDSFNVPSSRANEFFMRNLSERESLGAYFSNVGMTYYKQKKPEKAVEYLNLAVKVNTRSLEALNNLANIHSELKQYDLAIKAYKQALQADPNSLETLFNLGITQSEAELPDQAIESFLQVVQMDARYFLAHEALVQLYLGKRKPVSALLHLKQLYRFNPRDIQTLSNIGNVYLQLKQYSLALIEFKKAEQMNPKKPDVLEGLAEAYYRLDDFDQAMIYFRYLTEEAPSNLSAHVQLGWTHYRKGELRMAIAWTQRGLARKKENDPFLPLAYMNLGLYHLLEKNFPMAESAYEKALTLNLGATKQGTIDDLKSASKKFMSVFEIDYFMGWIYFKAEQKPLAKKYLESYLGKSPEGPLSVKARTLLRFIEGNSTETPESPAPSVPFPPSENEEARPEADPDMVEIPEGPFIMGSEDNGPDEKPEHKVQLDAFYIDRYEVSAKDYAAFLNQIGTSKGYYHDNKFGTLEYNGTFRARPGLEDFPVNNVSWFGANAYCEWKKKRLPTEAEWEKAARGPNGRIFPWGDQKPSHDQARFFQTWTEEIKHRVMVPVTRYGNGTSVYGVFNLAGNVKEWVDDWYDREYYSETEHQINPRGPLGGEFKVLKGGSWRDLSSFLYSSFRNNNQPESRMDDYGFRCAKDADGGKAPVPPASKKRLIRWNGSLGVKVY